MSPYQSNPLTCQKTPKTARDILNRVNEITFNASLLHELRAIDFVTRLLDEGSLDPNRYRKMFIHLISDEKGFEPLNASSKLNTEWCFLKHLHSLGYAAASSFLKKHYDSIGDHSSMDFLTQLTCGAACGEAVLGRKIGKKAIVWGAVLVHSAAAQFNQESLIPD